MERPTTVRMSELYDFLKYQERSIVDIIKDTNSNCHELVYVFDIKKGIRKALEE